MKAVIKKIKALKPEQAAVLALYYSQADSCEWNLMCNVLKDDDGDDVFDDCRAVMTACLGQAYQWGKDADHSFPLRWVDPFRSLPDPWDILESLKDSWFEGYQDGDYDNRRDAYEAHEARCF